MDERNNDFDFDFMPIGQAIKKAREARGMTREQLSGIIGYAPRHIQSIENEGKYPSIELFIQLITMFDVSVDEYIFLHNACVVDCTVIIPIKKDNTSCRWLIIPPLPLSVALKPIHTVRTEGILWYDSAFQITALLGTARYKAGTPFHTAVKTVPRPFCTFTGKNN